MDPLKAAALFQHAVDPPATAGDSFDELIDGSDEPTHAEPAPPSFASIANGVTSAPSSPSFPTPYELNLDREILGHLRQARVPLPPAWVLDAACDAWAAQFALMLPARSHNDEARAEALRLLTELMRETVRDPGYGGTKRRLLQFYEAEARFQAFVSTYPAPEDYRDTFLGFYVPVFNATNATVRRCLECGGRFSLTNHDEIERFKYCPPPKGKKRSACQGEVEKRARKENKRKHTADEVQAKLAQIAEAITKHRCLTLGRCNILEAPCANARRAGTGKVAKLQNKLRRLTTGKADAYRILAPGYDVSGSDPEE